MSQSIDAEQTENLLHGLEQAGWLKKVTAPTGGRPAHRWMINDQLFGNAGSAETAESLDGASAGMPLGALSALPALSATQEGDDFGGTSDDVGSEQ